MNSPTILVVDSDPLQRQSIESLLASFTVVSFTGGQEALIYFQTHTPDLAIFAERLPDINGTDICGRIKSIKRLRHVPVIITTSQQRYGTVKDLARAVRADLVLPKPLEEQDLAAQARGLIDPESFLEVEEVEDAEVIERALKRLESKSARQLEEEEDLKDLLEANQNLHRQLEALKQENRQLKEDTLTDDEINALRLNVEALHQENQRLKEQTAEADKHGSLKLDFESLKKDYADLAAQVKTRNDSKDLKEVKAELERSKAREQSLSARLAELEANPEKIVYRGEEETLQTLEALQEKYSVQERQIETLRKHNQKLLESLNEMQLIQSSRKGLLDRFRS